jgi:hypothetical protein
MKNTKEYLGAMDVADAKYTKLLDRAKDICYLRIKEIPSTANFSNYRKLADYAHNDMQRNLKRIGKAYIKQLETIQKEHVTYLNTLKK